MALVIDGVLACCGVPPTRPPTYFKQISAPTLRRSRPSKPLQEQLLREQLNRCLYCDREFGSTYRFGRREVVVRIAWDHMVPFTWRQNNGDRNWAAACMRCNAWKGSRVFGTVQEVRDYVAPRWIRYLNYGIRARDVPRLPILTDVAS